MPKTLKITLQLTLGRQLQRVQLEATTEPTFSELLVEAARAEEQARPLFGHYENERTVTT